MNETIKRNYGAVQSATFFMKKNHFCLTLFFCLLKMYWLRKKLSKKLWCSFFGGQNDPEIFFEFSKKNQKKWKKYIFFEKMLMVSCPFLRQVILPYIITNIIFFSRKKMSKKTDFHFLKLFFKMKIGHLFLSIFEFKKKLPNIKNFSIFSVSLTCFGEMESDDRVNHMNFYRFL